MIIAISVTLFFLVLRFTVTVFNFISNPKLTRVNKRYDALVSILIPVRNEEHRILSLLESIKQQDYKNYEVIIYDDDSTDRTYEVCVQFAAGDSRFSIIKGAKLPDGWLGKNYACNQLAKQAHGNYFLFLDADVKITANFINSAVHRMQLYNLGLLSIFPNQDMKTIGEKTTVPLANYLLLNLLPLRLVYLTKSPMFSVACGQCMLFDGDTYRKNEWHKQVKNKMPDDTEIMKLVKAKLYNGEALLANGMVNSRDYKNYREAINGFSKNLIVAFNYNVFTLLIYILVVIGGPMIILTTLNLNLIFFMTGLIVLTRVMISLSTGQQTGYNILLHPMQMINLVIMAFLSIQRYLTRSIIWKGRKI